MAKKENVTKAVAGDTMDVVQRVTVKPKCDQNDGHWYCETHLMAFLNQMMKDHHISKGKHHLAWICVTHGYEEP